MIWFDKAACAGIAKVDPTIFFPDVERGHTGPHVWDQARAICRSCVVRHECLEYQMKFEEESGRRDGMWGGYTPKEREQLFQERIRLQPRGRGNP
jgi:WhiB family redox-sensing transcriptional regulator